MPYIGRNHIAGDHTSNFKVLDDISSFTATFDGSASSVVDTTNNTIRVVEHRFIQGQRVTYTNGSGGNIGGLTTGTAYFVIFDSASTIKLATSASNAANNTVINLSAVGSGTSHTLNAAFDGVNTKFKITYNGGTGARFNNATQLNIAINNVLQKPNTDSLSYTEGFAIEDNHKIVFKVAPTSEDIFWGSIIANTLTTFDISDHKIDTFTGDGSTTEFNLSHTPANNESLMVTINGVLQHPSNASTTRAYTLIASIIQFTAAPANGDEIQVRHLGFAGATTADVSGFYGRTGNVVLTANDHITTGDITARNINASGILTASSASFGGNVSIGGTLTYEDVTNIDSVGLITARNGAKIQTGTATTALVVEGNARVTGILTVGTGSITLNETANTINVGTALTLGHTQGLQFHTQNLHSLGFEVNQINASGIITASAFKGDGSDLTGIDADKIFEGNTEVETIDTGSDGHIKFTTEGSERLRIDNNGKVLIATSTTSEAHANNDELIIGGTSDDNNHGLTIVTPSSKYGTVAFSDGSSGTGQGLLEYNHSGDYMRIYTAGSERFRIDQYGNAGLGVAPRTAAGGVNNDTDVFLAIGDSDTGIAQDGDGQFEIWANNQEIANFNASNITFTKDLFIPDKLRHDGDSDTQIRFPADDTVSIETAGSTRLHIHSDGRFRVGTTSQPSGTVGGFQLDMGSYPGTLRLMSGAGASGTQSASVNIGGSNHNASLAHGSNSGASLSLFNYNTTDGNSTTVSFHNSNSLAIARVLGHIESHSNRLGNLVFMTSDGSHPVEKARLTHDGRFAIGTDNPESLLHINNSSGAALMMVTSSTQPRLMLKTTGTSAECRVDFGDIGDSSRGAIGYNHTDDALKFYTSGVANERLRITSDGKVGINQTNPKAQLDVINTTAPTLDNNTHAGEALFLRSGGSDGDGNVQAIMAFGKADSSSLRSGSAIASVQTDSDADKIGIGFYTSPSSSSSQTLSQKVLITHDGKILIGDGNTYTPGSHVHIHGGTTGVQQLRVQNHTSIGSFDGNYGSEFRHATSSANHAMLIHCHEAQDSRRTLDISSQNGIFASFTNGKFGLGTVGPDSKLHIVTNSSTAYSTSEVNTVNSTNALLRLENTNGGDGSGVNNYVGIYFRVANGANSDSQLQYVRTGDNAGTFHFKARNAGSSYPNLMAIKSDGNTGFNGTIDPKSTIHFGSNQDLRIGGQYGGLSQIMEQVEYTAGYTGTHWQFETNNMISWSFDGVLIVYGGGGSSYGSEVTKITIVYSRESGANNSGDTWRNGTTSYNIETLGHGQTGLSPSSGSLTVTEDTAPDGAASTRSLFKLGWSSAATGGSTTVWSKLHGTIYWGTGSSGDVEIQDKDGNIFWDSNP